MSRRKDQQSLLPIETRKNQHVEIALSRDVEHEFSWGGFQDYQLEHCALPELSLSEIDTSTVFLGKQVSLPLVISPITGGTPETFTILRTLAEAAEEKKVALGVGSQRIAMENQRSSDFFRIRDVAPSIPILANLGAVQLNYGLTVSRCQKAVEVEADALVLHLNPLHESLQNDGNTDFRSLLPKIDSVIRSISVPVIIKEVGFGISLQVARKLASIGVAAIDLAGAGGTSWPLIESSRALSKEQRQLALSFTSWGLPTAWLLEQYRKELRPLGVQIIAGGGIRSGIDIARPYQRRG